MARPKDQPYVRAAGSIKCKHCGKYNEFTHRIPDKCQKCGGDL